jgi:general secretion pathway protein A
MTGVYLERFGLREEPFRLTPDPKYLYRGEQYERALVELRYGIDQRKGFMVLTGEVGTGKTTICRALLDSLDPDTKTALVLNPTLSTEELLRTIIQDFGLTELPGSASKKDLVDYLNGFLLRVALDEETALLIVDEAQNLSHELLEELRMLSNLETEREKLLQILLIGQPELADKLSSKKLRQLKQRVSVWTHLAPMKLPDTSAYVLRRLTVASRGSLMVSLTNGAFRKLQALSGGIPRTINLICDRALIAAFAKDEDRVSMTTVKNASREILSGSGRRVRTGWTFSWSYALLPVLLLTAFLPLIISRSGGGKPVVGPDTPKQEGANAHISGKAAIAQEGNVPEILSRYFAMTGFEYLGKEALLWRIRSARVSDIELALRVLDIDRQYGLKTAVIPLAESLWRKAGTVGIVKRTDQDKLSLILPADGSEGFWRLVSAGGEENTLHIDELAESIQGKNALVLYRSLAGLDRSLARGDAGASVYALQDYLSNAGILSGSSVDGIFGSETQRALARLQEMLGVEPTGILDSSTGYFMATINHGEWG